MSNIALWVDYKGDKPAYSTQGSAGCDLISTEDVKIPVGARALVGTGLFLEIPQGFVGMVCPRSGLALKHGITVLNAPGIVDSDYRGEVKVVLINLSNEEYSVKKGDRIAQLVFSPIIQVNFKASSSLSLTDRGNGGFGSTGT